MLEHAPEEISFLNSFVDKGLKERLEHVAGSEFARITCIGKAGQDNEEVISEAPYRGMTDDIRAGRYFDASYHRIHR